MMVGAIVLLLAVLVAGVGLMVEYRQTRTPPGESADDRGARKGSGFKGLHATTVGLWAVVAATVFLATASLRTRSVPIDDLAFNSFVLGIAADRLIYLITLRGWPAGGRPLVARVIAGTAAVLGALAFGLTA
jgi:uncharacterized membrane-anchored protein